VKESSHWYSERLGTEVRLTRWGAVGTPVLLYPTAGGDAEECERFHLVDAVGPLLQAGRIKLYSCDSVAGRTWVERGHSPEHRVRMQDRFDRFVAREVVPAIRSDCRSDSIEVVTAGASIGAFNAIASLCRHPDLFRAAVCLSGTYDVERFIGDPVGEAFYFCSPLWFLPDLPDGPLLHALRSRFVILAHGEGRWEDPSQSFRMADALGHKGIPNRVDAWGTPYDHDWPTWRQMLPRYLDELTSTSSGPDPARAAGSEPRVDARERS